MTVSPDHRQGQQAVEQQVGQLTVIFNAKLVMLSTGCLDQNLVLLLIFSLLCICLLPAPVEFEFH
jgi:hypothetical protein